MAGLRIALAVAGGLAAQGAPHSPWLFGTGPVALAKGFWHAHMGWLFERVSTNAERFAPDLLATGTCGSPTGCSRCGSR